MVKSTPLEMKVPHDYYSSASLSMAKPYPEGMRSSSARILLLMSSPHVTWSEIFGVKALLKESWALTNISLEDASHDAKPKLSCWEFFLPSET